MEILQWVIVGGCVSYLVYAGYEIKQSKEKIKEMRLAYAAALELIVVETQRRVEHTKALKRLTDPESIADEMERGARKREMYDANRNLLPRENAGPPAKVYSPKLRANVPRSGYKNNQK